MNGDREYARSVYATRKASRQCVTCKAGLQSRDGVRCLECATEHYRKTTERRRRNPEHVAALERARYRRNVETRRERQRADRETAIRDGYCVQCPRRRMPDCTFCPEHREVKRLVSLIAYLRREGKPVREAKAQLRVARLAAKRQHVAPVLRLVPDLPVRDEDGHGQWRPKLLKAMRFYDWVDTQDLFAAMGVEQDCESVERNTVQVSLGRLVKLGLVERRSGNVMKKLLGLVGSDYRLTDAGRAEIGALRRAA